MLIAPPSHIDLHLFFQRCEGLGWVRSARTLTRKLRYCDKVDLSKVVYVYTCRPMYVYISKYVSCKVTSSVAFLSTFNA